MKNSEEQMKKKQCPLNAAAVTNYESAHGIKEAREVGLSCNCIGSHCAMYRERPANGNDDVFAYCGLAGKPIGL